MSYSSYAGAIGSDPIALLKDGSEIIRGEKISTTDALQLQKMYCKDMTNDDGTPMFPNFQYKERTSCTSSDEVGETRTVFIDRICDGYKGKNLYIRA